MLQPGAVRPCIRKSNSHCGVLPSRQRNMKCKDRHATLRSFVLLVIVVALVPGMLAAQELLGSLTGTVTDSGGTVVPTLREIERVSRGGSYSGG
jgi:hypothetical protein